MKSKFNKYLLSFCLMFLSMTAFSQKTPPPPAPPPNPGNEIPIDGGLTYLLLTGIAYGIFELKRKK